MSVYYIKAAGSGANTGLSDAQAWDLAKFGSFAFSAGDTILFKKGDTFTGTTIFTRSGSSGSPITLDAYGSSAHNPILDGAASTTNRTLRINSNFVTVNNLTIQNSFVGAYGTLFLSGVHDITINNCHVSQGYRGILAQNCTGNIVINGCYTEKISHVDPAGVTNTAMGDGSHIQFDHCTGAGNNITNNKCYTAVPDSGVGDIISLFVSSGTTGSWIQITGNKILGGGTSTSGKCGIGLGDNGGQYQYVRNNLLSSTGYSGIQIAGGDSIDASNNKIYSAQNVFPQGQGSLLGISIFSTGVAPTNLTVGNNNINWKDYNGNVNNFNLGSGVATPAGWATNTALHTQDPLAPSTLLPNPLFAAGDWDVVVIPVITYGSLYSFTYGTSISPVIPGGSSYYPVTSYSISPGLPSGLSFDITTGQITGTPSALLASTNFTVTANSIGGQGTVTFNLQVVSTGAIPYYTAIKFI